MSLDIKINKYKPGDVLELKIQSLSPGGGKGISKTEGGMVVFTPFVVPGDLVKVKLFKVKKRYAEAELIQVLKESEKRIAPPCAVFGECGGCQWQMMSYKEQVHQKNEFLKYEFNKIGFNKDIKTLPSEKNFRYRNRIQVHQKGSKLGFIKKKTNDLISVSDCLIADEDLVTEFKNLLKEKKTRRVEIAKDSNEEVHKYEGGKRPADLNLFSQINSSQNINLINHILDEVKSINKPLKSVFDLYCGNGNITFPLQSVLKDSKITGVELSKMSIKRAKEIQSNKGIKEISFIADDVLNFLKKNKKIKLSPDLILLDPPRSGAGEAVAEEIVQLGSENIFYISCDLATLIRDIKILLKDYSIESVKGFDMFPQTYHLETFVRLKKK